MNNFNMPNMNSGNQDQAWWIRYGARGVGCGGGIRKYFILFI